MFLVDHAWTFQGDCVKKQLEMISGLAARMGRLMGLVGGEGEGSYDADSESGVCDQCSSHQNGRLVGGSGRIVTFV